MKEAAEKAAKDEEEKLSKIGAFAELKVLATHSDGTRSSSNGASKVRF